MDTSDLITAEALAQMPGGSDFELDRGRLVRVNPVNPEHGRMAVLIGALLLAHTKLRRLGTVMVEAGFILSRNPDTLRGPDVSFVRAGRPNFPPPRGFASGAPDLAVEIVSPDNSMPQLLAKAAEYVDAGTELVWIVDHEDRSVRVFRPGAAMLKLGVGDALDGGTTLPGFHLALAELFSPA